MSGEPEIAVGRIVAPHGIRGEVRVQPWTDYPERFQPGMRVFVERGPGWTTVQSVRSFRGGLLLLRLEGIGDRNAAERLRGARLLIPRSERVPLPPGAYYTLDLLGWPVVRPDGVPVGRLRDVLRAPAHDLLEVELADGRRALVPAVRALVEIDEQARRIVVQPVPGLLEGEAMGGGGRRFQAEARSPSDGDRTSS